MDTAVCNNSVMEKNETESDGFDSLRAAGVSEARIEAMKATAARMAERSE